MKTRCYGEWLGAIPMPYAATKQNCCIFLSRCPGEWLVAQAGRKPKASEKWAKISYLHFPENRWGRGLHEILEWKFSPSKTGPWGVIHPSFKQIKYYEWSWYDDSIPRRPEIPKAKFLWQLFLCTGSASFVVAALPRYSVFSHPGGPYRCLTLQQNKIVLVTYPSLSVTLQY